MQLVREEGGERKRHVIAASQCGAIFRRLASGEVHWSVVDAPSIKPKRAVESLENEKSVVLCTPKLDAVLRYLQGELPTRIVILETRRERDDEPWYAGEILKRRAKDLKVNDVVCEAYLVEANEPVEDRRNPIDAVVRRKVVERIDDAIRCAVGDAKRVVICSSGGMPEIKALIREFSRLYAMRGPAGVVEVVDVEDRSEFGEPDRAFERKELDPVEAVRVRRHALRLIERGNFIGAWAVAERIHQKREDQRFWTNVVEELYCFASSLPIKAEPSIKVLKTDKKAAWSALRVEAALRAKDIPRAIQGTVAFLEAALWDHWAKYDFERDGLCGNPRTGFTRTSGSSEDKGSRYRYDERRDRYWPIVYERKAVDEWVEVLGSRRLRELNAAVRRIRHLRNDVSHGEPGEDTVASATKEMVEAGLWSRDEPRGFLRQPLVKDVLAELNVNAPERLWKDLFDEVRRRILRLDDNT